MLNNGSTTIICTTLVVEDIMLHVLIAVLLQELLSVDGSLNNADLTDLMVFTAWNLVLLYL